MITRRWDLNWTLMNWRMKTNVSYLQCAQIVHKKSIFSFQNLPFIQSLISFKSLITENIDKKARVRRIWRDVKNFFRKKTSDYTKREPQLDLDEMEDEDQRKLQCTQIVHKEVHFILSKVPSSVYSVLLANNFFHPILQRPWTRRLVFEEFGETRKISSGRRPVITRRGILN